MSEARRSAPALEVKGLDVYYGHSHALQGVDLTLDSGVFSVVGRNGMGKTTLCKTIMGLVRASGGSVRIRGEEATGLSPARIARLGVGYVPQGRRLWRSLSVDEHLALAAGMRRGPWTIERIYETFPRLAERKDHGGSQLSGGEQQMLAISRALLTNPHLADHGRADRRIGAGDRRPGRGDAGAPRRGRRHVGARDRAEYRRGDGDVPECRHHGQWPRQPYHRFRASCRRSRPATAPAWRRAPQRP